MLNTFRNNKKSIIGIVIAGFMALSMIGFGMNSLTGGGRNNAGNKAIQIGSETISFEAYYNKLEQITQLAKYQFGENFETVKTMLNLEQRTIDEIVKEYAVKDLINTLGLTASTSQIEAHIQNLEFFKKFGFNKDTYNSFLASQGLNGERLEEQTRLAISAEQLQNILTDLNLPTKEELKAIYNNENTVYELNYVSFVAKDFESKVNKEDNEKLNKYFTDFAEKYRKPRTIKYTYIKFDPKDYLNKVGEITETEIEESYLQRQSQFAEPKELKLSEIVFNKAKDQSSEVEKLVMQTDQSTAEALTRKKNEAIKEKAKLVVEKLKNGEKFSELAKQYSEDKTTSAKGGDLGWLKLAEITKEVLVVADKVERGKFSDIIETADQFVIIMVDDVKEKRIKDLSEVKAQIDMQLKEIQAPEYAKASAEDYLQKFSDLDIGLNDFANKNNLTAKSSDKFLASNESTPDAVGLTAKVINFTQGEKQLINIGEMTYLVEINETKDSYIPTLEDVKEDVLKDFVKNQSVEMAKEAANKFLTEAKNAPLQANAVTEVASHNSLKTDKMALKRSDKTNEAFLGNFENKKAVLSLNMDSPLYQNILSSGSNFYVVQLANKILPDQANIESKLTELSEQQKTAFSNRLSSYILEIIKEESNIWVNPKLLEKTAGNFQI